MTTLPGRTPAELQDLGAGATAREIAQQPAVWRETARLAAASWEATEAFLRPLLADSALRIVLTGAGTSSFAGEVLAPALARRLHRRVDAVATTDIVSNPREAFAEDVRTLLVSFARSGDSPESVAATRLADECLSECHHLVITCNAEGRLALDHSQAARSRVLVMPAEANDQGFAMTSSFTSMTLTGLLTLAGPPDVALADRLASTAEAVLATRTDDARALAAQGFERIVYLGSGPLKGLARESALKVLELTAGRIVASSDSSLGFRHGPKAVLDERTLVVVYLSSDPYTRRYDLDIVTELRAALPAGHVITISATPDGNGDDGTWLLPGLEGADDAAMALPAVICAQLIGLHASLALGRTPDNPFPSGEVNRVVQGVILHPLAG